MQHFPPMILTNETNAFAHNTMKVRVPAIIQETLDLNPDYSTEIKDRLKRLREEIRGNEVIGMIDENGVLDYAGWQRAHEDHRGNTWLGTDWFFAETFFYRRLIEAVNWWETKRDPFAPKKELEWEGDTVWELLDIALSVEGSTEERLASLLEFALWGNRIDLSYAISEAHGAHADADDLLVDDREKIVHQLLSVAGDVHVVADNAGTELAMDLVLIDALLRYAKERVVLHLKIHPTFVSDATISDVQHFMNLLNRRGYQNFAERLQQAINDKRLELRANAYWNSGFIFPKQPSAIRMMFEGAKAVFFKGDANYRRIVGDALWEPETSFAHVMQYFPHPTIALRTLKSDPVVGLPSGLATKLDTIDDQWRVNGKRGLIQSTL